MRKTIKIELVVDDGLTQKEKRQQLRAALNDPRSKLRRGLANIGWSESAGSLTITVSNPKRTAHWDA